MTTASSTLTARLKDQALRAGFDLVGIAPIAASEHAEFYRAWLAEQRHGEMAYLARPDAVERRVRPDAAWPAVRSAVVVAQNYYVPDDDGAPDDPARGIIARYARGRDYHKVIKQKLLRLLAWLEQEAGRTLPAARAYVDTGPVLERELARRAGIGWFGKNTMILNPKRGSYFFLGTLLVELDLEYDQPFAADHCGTCNACVEACPTGALLGRDASGAPVIDATRCISYLTIEQRGPIPRDLRPLIGNRVFGCDICQEVCPWNGPKFVQLTREEAYRTRGRGETGTRGRADTGTWGRGDPGTRGARPADVPALVELMGMDEQAWNEFSRGSAIRRARRAGFLRNVAVALGNWGALEAVPALVRALDDPEPLVRGHAAWALGRIASEGARAALSKRLAAERDVSVVEELRLALAD